MVMCVLYAAAGWWCSVNVVEACMADDYFYLKVFTPL
jgi:hypothetical protein